MDNPKKEMIEWMMWVLSAAIIMSLMLLNLIQ